jgi:hypothetical protein
MPRGVLRLMTGDSASSSHPVFDHPSQQDLSGVGEV